jgi:hypothetical protein
MRLWRVVSLAWIGLAAAPAFDAGAFAAWGPRFGVSDSPDQFLAGFHWTAGTVSPRLVLQPSAKIGVGSERKIFFLSAPLHYRIPVRSSITPFIGGGVAAGVIDRDGAQQNDTDFELGLDAIGGLEWRLRGGARFALELNLGFGDLYDIQLLAGWILR